MTHQSDVRSAACGRTEEEEAAVLADARAVVAASGLFDADHYLWHLPEAAAAGLDPIEHYLREGWHRDADPGPGFSTHYYVAVNDDVREAGLNPLVHYVKWGKAEGRLPLPPLLRPAGAAVRPPRAPTPEEWEALAAAWNGPAAEPEVDVLVPVYGGFDETMRCLFSVLSARAETPHSLIVVDDCTPDPKLCEGVEALAARGLIELHRTPQNLGFVGACNLGMALHRSRDVVLLNSDTEVFGDWLDRLRAAALRRPRTGTVTPLSNNAEICSYPHFVRDNGQQLEVDDATLDRLAALANAGSEVEIPTGVGFCIYVRRTCLDEVGLFDVESFGKGYGEENDLCRRAAAAGWRNILAPDIFVRHHGAASFGAGKAARVALAVKTVERLHPGYLRRVGEFIESDPVRPFREALDVARLTSRARMGAILFVTHSWGGGTERHVQDLSRLLEADGTPVFFCRVDAEIPGRVRIEDPGAPETPNLRTFDVERDLGRFAATLRRTGVAHVHVHSLAGYPESAPDFIRSACAASDLAYDVTLHDYAVVCPRIHLIDRSGIYCGEPDLATCERCIGRDGSPFGRPSVWLWRERYARFLSGARRVFVPHADVARRMRRFLPRVAFTVRPHPEPPPRRAPSPAAAATSANRSKAGRPRRVALLGAIGPHKGSILLADTARAASAQGLLLEFVVVGYTDRDEELQALGNVEITGRFEEGEAAAGLAAAGADIAWFPAVWPETYSYTLSAALDARVFPVAFDFGAIAARIYASGWGDVMPIGLMLDPAAGAHRLAEMPVPPPPSDVGHLHAAAVYVDPLASYYQLRDPPTPVSSAATPSSAAFVNRDPSSQIPGGFEGKSVLELGPFKG